MFTSQSSFHSQTRFSTREIPRGPRLFTHGRITRSPFSCSAHSCFTKEKLAVFSLVIPKEQRLAMISFPGLGSRSFLHTMNNAYTRTSHRHAGAQQNAKLLISRAEPPIPLFDSTQRQLTSVVDQSGSPLRTAEDEHQSDSC